MANTADSPLRVMFLTTSMPVGGAETLLVNLVRGMDRQRFAPEIVCLKEPGPLGDELAREMPVHSNLLAGKYDLRILPRLWRLLRARRADAVVTVGAGDKMFWGRVAARLAGTPVVASALHSTGWPDGVGRLNRLLTRWTDAFIAVADNHAEFLVDFERFPADKVRTIYNGVDTDRFAPHDASAVRQSLGLAASAPVIGILAALRPEKNHELFLRGAKQILAQHPDARFVVVGDGPRRGDLEALAAELQITDAVHFLGSRSDVPQLLSAIDVLALTSHNEASPVSILEALSCCRPVVASRVGSVAETVVDGVTGLLVNAGDEAAYVAAVNRLLDEPQRRAEMGVAGRQLVESKWSLAGMIRGYEDLIAGIYEAKTQERREPKRRGWPRFGWPQPAAK
ncbi:MAG: glycosyl transferase family 1 [Planctomycetaceae bacterium]|nr:glycosyl transferase family 1 [Planctomycetaceae bacterium]